MKKSILYSLLVIAIAFTGCQNTKIDPVNDTTNQDRVESDGFAISNYTKEINVTKIDDTYPIDFTLSKYDVPLKEETVAIKVFNDKYGEMVESFVATDINGKGHFKYLSPHKFPTAGTTIYITYLIVLEEEGEDKDSDKVTEKKFLEAPVRINFR